MTASNTAECYSRKRQHRRWKISQELVENNTFFPDYTHAKIASRKRERSNQIKSNLLMQKGQLATKNHNARQYKSNKNSSKSL